jgi:hypothetical protein
VVDAAFVAAQRDALAQLARVLTGHADPAGAPFDADTLRTAAGRLPRG